MNSFQLLRIKIPIDCTPVWKKLPVNYTFKIHITHNITLGPNQFFNYDFGRLTGTEPLFRGFRIAVIDSCFITCDNSPDKSIIHGITGKLTTDIHSMFNMLRCQFRSSDLQFLYDFPCFSIWRCMLSFDAPNSSDSLRILFCGFSSKPLRIFFISHNLGLPERGKCLVFFFFSLETLEP